MLVRLINWKWLGTLALDDSVRKVGGMVHYGIVFIELSSNEIDHL